LRPKGGRVRVEVRTPEGEELKGEAICAKTENFSKRYGRTLALVRALNLRPQNKYKAGDEVWGVSYHMEEGRTKILKAKIKSVSQHGGESIISEDLKEIKFVYSPCYLIEDRNLLFAENDTFSSKEELLNHLQS